MGLVTQEVLRKYFEGAKISSRWPLDGYSITTSSGGTATVLSNGDGKNIRGGVDIYGPLAAIYRDVLGRTMKVEGPLRQIIAAMVSGQSAGVEVEVHQKRGWFRNQQIEIPRTSGAHGDAGIATDQLLAAAGLTSGQWGRGLRIAEGNSGNLIRYDGPNCVFITGPPGCGKQSRFATSLLVEAEETAMGVLDPKLELLAITKRARERIGPSKWIVPFKEGIPAELAHYADESDSYNPLALLDSTAESYVTNVDGYAEILVAPDGSGESKDSGFFSGNAQVAVAGVIMQLVENYPPEERTLSNVASIICTDRIFEFAATAMKTGTSYTKDRLSTFATPEAVMLKGGIGDILRTAREQLKWLSNPAIARILQTPKTPWKFDDLKRGDRPSTIYVGVSAKYLPTARRLFRLLLGCAVTELQTTPPGRWPVTLLADEFALLGKCPIFQTVFSEARGHGFKMVAIVQNAGQMISAYGREGFRNFLSGSEIQIFFPPRDLQTAQEISALAGKRTILTCNYSNGARDEDKWGGMSVGETGQDVLTPHQIMALPKDRMIIVAPGLVKDIIIARTRNYWEYPEIAALTDPNPYHSGGANNVGGNTTQNPRQDVSAQLDAWRNSAPAPKSTKDKSPEPDLDTKLKQWRQLREGI